MGGRKADEVGREDGRKERSERGHRVMAGHKAWLTPLRVSSTRRCTRLAMRSMSRRSLPSAMLRSKSFSLHKCSTMPYNTSFLLLWGNSFGSNKNTIKHLSVYIQRILCLA